jgi:RNA polymerase sigma-70 factor, ECF subfamily
MEEIEIQLIKKAQNGDQAAFTALVRQHDRRIFRMVQAILDDLLDSQDVYQETFLRAYQHLASFRFECQFSTWISQIAVNLARSRLRQRRLRQFLSLAEEHHPVTEQPPQESDLNQQALRHAVAGLRGNAKTVITLKYLQGYKIKEIAEIMGCHEGTVKNYLFRAIAKLRTSLT